MESDTDSKTQQTQDLEQPSAAPENETPTMDTNPLQLSRIEEALALNIALDEKYKELENVLSLRLSECREILAEIRKDILHKNTQKSGPSSSGEPYFTDENNVAAPDNEDTIHMQMLEMYDFSNLSVTGWTVEDKTLMENKLHEMSQVLRKEHINSEIAKLQRENGSKQEIDKLQNELGMVKEKSLAELALPIDQDYDWDNVANALHNRHSPNECRAFWKLFLHPSINKSSWTKEEHDNLQEIAIKHGQQNWDAIAKELNTGRTEYQCFVYFRANMSKDENGQK